MSETLSVEIAPKSIDELLETHDCRSEQSEYGKILSFHTPDGHDVYNITAPFEYEDSLIIAGRAERRADEISSLSRFYRYDSAGDTWVYDQSLPTLSLQDPFVARIGGQYVVGGVKIFPSLDNPAKIDGWETHIYAGPDLNNLELLTASPYMMKGVRLAELRDGRIPVVTRPQGATGGLGKVGVTIVDNLKDINAQVLTDAPILTGLFADKLGEWGGANELHPLPDGRIGVIGHAGRFVIDEGQKLKEYYGMSWIIDFRDGTVSDERIIACRDCFPPTESKKPETKRVVYSGGARLLGNLAAWYGGIGDAYPGVRPHIPNPFGRVPADNPEKDL